MKVATYIEVKSLTQDRQAYIETYSTVNGKIKLIILGFKLFEVLQAY
jgi:hypothetical protein